MTTATLTVLGTTDEVTACECCGRSDLKGTVVLHNGETEVYFGSDCAARAMGVSRKQVDKDVRSAAKAKAERDARERVRKANEERDAYQTWAVATFGDRASTLDRYRRFRAETGR